MQEKFKWYAIQTYSGSEMSVKKAIENLANEYGFGDQIAQVVVPTEDIIEVKNGTQRVVERTLYSGYVFVNIELDNALWHKIQSIPRVSRFVGESKKPAPLNEKDIASVLEKVNNRAAPKPKISFENGELVRIVDGPFANFNATVEDYDMIHGKLKLNVSIFGRSTPVEIMYSQVEKII